LVQDFHERPLKIPFNRIVATPGFMTPTGANAFAVTVKQTANNVDSIYLSFHGHDSRDNSICVQPFIKDVTLTYDGITLPSNIRMRTYNDITQRSMFLDSFNMQNNFAVTMSKDFDHSITPYFHVPVGAVGASGITFTNRTYLRTGDLTNFLIAYPNALDGTHNEGLFNKGGNFSWQVRGHQNANIFLYSNAAEVAMPNPFPIRKVYVTCVCDATLQLFASTNNIPKQVTVLAVNDHTNA
jgi:hypothetical protein